MAPRQLRLEPIEVDPTADKGVKRVRADSTEECSTQVQNLRPRDSLVPALAVHSALPALCRPLARAPAL
eukprot:scaffold16045_cov110-Isochrysis_galbana.AAC.10